MVLEINKKIVTSFSSFPEVIFGVKKGVFVLDLRVNVNSLLTIKILESQELKIISDNLFYNLGINHLTVILEKDSKLTITECDNSQLDEVLNVEQKQNSIFIYQKLYKSSGNSVLNLSQKGDKCTAEVQNIVIGQNIELKIDQNVNQHGKEQKMDHKSKFILSDNSNLAISHSGKSSVTSTNCTVNQRIKGVVLDIESKAEMQPVLEIDSDSSTCNHGASVGGFDRSEVQYLKTRGLDQAQTQKILVDSFLNDYYDKIDPICARERWRS
jgi:Fe-S cluster assembly protein SufD